MHDPFNTGLFGGWMFVQGHVATAQTVQMAGFGTLRAECVQRIE